MNIKVNDICTYIGTNKTCLILAILGDNAWVKADGVHNIIREIKDGYNELGMTYTTDDVLSVLVSVYGFRAEQLAGVKL